MRIVRKVLFALVAVLAVTVAQAETPAGLWFGNNNGTGGWLILSVDNAGTVTGTAFGDNIKGFWNQNTGKLVFYRAIGANSINGGLEMDPSSIQIYTGYVFPCTTSGLTCMAGTFEAFSGTGATKQRNVFGWSAQAIQ